MAGRVVEFPRGRRCVECDELIPPRRLHLMPKAKRCVGCEEFKEVRKRSCCLFAGDRDIVIIKG